MSSKKLEGKVAVVTGAGGTLCSTMASDLARRGAAVVLLGRTESKLQAVADKITRDGGRQIVCVADVMDLDALQKAHVLARQAFGSCDILINGAGGNQADAITATTEFTPDELDKPETRGFFNLDLDAFQRVIDVNMMGTVKPCQVFGEDMARQGGGVIINFASMTSYRPLSRVGAYGAAKAGVCSLTQWLACYLAPAGILAGIAEVAPDNLHWFHGPKGAPLRLLAYYLMIVLKYNGNWAFIQRLYAVRDERSAQNVAICSAVLFYVAPVIFLLPAIAARVVVPDLVDPERSYVAICGKLLPAGMMGLMIASMFAATSSALNSEFNVMAGVLTNDLYKRVLAPKSSDRAQFRFARIMTVVIGGLITTGAVFVGYFGGAFEANKLFTGILAIPLAVPLVFGLLLRRPDWRAALVVVFGGALLGLTLNLAGWFAWEVSTLITIVACFAIFAVSRLMRPTRKKEVDVLFQQINTPLSPAIIPSIDPGFLIALKRLFSLSLFISGSFFAVVSMLAIRDLSGQLALAAAVMCVALGMAYSHNG